MQKTIRNNRISAPKALLGILLAIVILAIAQSLAFSISEIFLNAGLPGAICNILAGVLYVVLAFLGVDLFCKKYMKISREKMRIPGFRLKPVWVLSAVLMPVLVLLLSLAFGGHWEINRFDTATTLAMITGAVAFYGLATGIVEEMIFRGLVMGCLEERFGKKIVVIVPSVLFGALHIIGNHLDFVSTIQLLIAGSIVGILFSLITCTDNSVWNSAIVHGIWNMAIIGGILHIGDSADSSSMFNFVLKNKSFLVSGGDFGIEASVISIFVYLIFCALAAVYGRGKQKRV